jgi:hypothetical protein
MKKQQKVILEDLSEDNDNDVVHSTSRMMPTTITWRVMTTMMD